MNDAAIVDLYWQRSDDAITETDQKYGAYCGTIAWIIAAASSCYSAGQAYCFEAVP